MGFSHIRCFGSVWSGFASVFVFLLLLTGTAHADKVILKNGNVIEGRILREDDRNLVISTGASELSVAVANVDRIERGISVEYILQRARKALETGERFKKAGNGDQARKVFEAGILELETASESLEPVPETLAAVKKQLEDARRSVAVVANDPESARAEELYEQALRAIDHISYADAFRLLTQAAEIKPDRTDIQYRLAIVSQELNNPDSAIRAYRRLLELDADTYYAESAPPLLVLLNERGRRLIADRKADEAIDYFREVLLLQGAAKGKTVELSEFLSRKTSREKDTEDKVLMEVYKYADDNDLVDLAFAAITRVSKLKPDDPDVKRLVRETDFLAKFQGAISKGDLEGAAKLVAEASPDVIASERVSKKIDASAGGIKDELEAGRLLAEAKFALESEEFKTALEKAREVTTRFASTDSASEALKILAEAELEAPIKDEVVAIRNLRTNLDFDGIEARIGELTKFPNFEKSRYREEIGRIAALLPAEREADRLYTLAKAQIDRSEFDKAIVSLEEVSGKYPETVAGGKASEWLAEYRTRLMREAEKTRMFEQNSFFAIADPNLWRAASSGPTRGLKLAAVDQSLRPQAWKVFNEMNAFDLTKLPDPRSRLLHVVLPIVLGLGILGWLVFKYARPGKGVHREPEAMVSSDAVSLAGVLEATSSRTSCRMCGLKLLADSLLCPTCGAPAKLTEVEEGREQAQGRQANYDPWDIRVKARTANEFETHFQKARDLAQTSDVQAAIEMCRAALSEDPHRKDGYQLLADLYERAAKPEEAAKCYREILLIDPADIIVRQKIESLLSLSSQPLELGRVVILLSGAFWWLVFWMTIGIDPQTILIRLGLCLAGAALTVVYWNESQKHRKLSVQATQRGNPDIHRPLSTTDLNWKAQRIQALTLAKSISEHTGIDVPALTPARIIFVILLSLLLLATMVAIAWLNHMPWVFLGWPAGVALLVFLLEIYPRVYTAHIVLRHVFEETSSPWVDPHRPFKPNNTDVKGEFLIRSFKQFPLRWALKPDPYPPTRQGVLNSLQQTMNRHWACHRFYEGLHVVRDIEIPVPTGMKSLLGAVIGVLLIGIVSAGSIAYLRQQVRTRYQEEIQLGYLALLEGDLVRSHEAFSRAIAINRRTALPHLYMAHADASAGMNVSAERAFRSALTRSGNLAVIHNDFGNFLQREGRLREAILQYLAALGTDSKNPDILNNLGSGYFKIGEYQKAVAQLNEAVKVEPEHPRAWTTLGLAYEAIGDTENARMAFEKAVEVAPDVPYTQVARDRLAAGEADKQGKPLVLEAIRAQ